MKSEEFVSILKEDSEAFISKDDKFIRIIAEYLHINDFTICKPTYLHIVNDNFVTIDGKVRIELKDINELMVL